MSLHNCSLFYKDGGSDKVYQVQIEENKDGFFVHFQYGKRGGSLKEGIKNTTPITTETEALAVYNKLINEKKSKGYTEDSTGAVFQSTSLEERKTGIVPQLLNKIVDPQTYIDDDSFFMQEKFDGQRRLHSFFTDKIIAINKKGLEVPALPEVISPIQKLGVDLVLDGELVGTSYYIFDILHYDGKDLKEQSAKSRYEFLVSLNLPNTSKAYFSCNEKQKAFADMEDKKKEGVVFKKNDSAYVAGRPNSGGNQLKYKFYATDTFEVVSHNKTKRSVNIVSYQEDGSVYDMGKITIPETTPMPQVGEFIEVRYLYCHVGGKLFQTTYLGVRNDQDKTDCHMREIKFKSSLDDDEE